MKRVVLFIFMLLFITANVFCKDSAYDKARFAKNEKWKKYVKEMNSKLSGIDLNVFQSLMFESSSPGNDFDFIKDIPAKKYKIADYQVVSIPTVDKKIALNGWFFPVKDAKGTIVVLHGYSSDADFGLYQSRFLLEKGYQLLVYNARFWSYSKTPEKYMLSLEKEMSDVGSVIAYLKTRKDVDMNKLGIFGFSQGAYKTVIAGSRYKEFKVVMEDAAPVNRMWWGENKELNDAIKMKNGEDFSSPEYITTSVADKISPRAFLILHGGKDMSVPVSNSQAIFDKALEPKEFKIFPKSAHCLGMVQADKEDYIKSVTEFLDKYLK